MKHGVECWLSPSPASPAWHSQCGGRTLPQPCVGLQSIESHRGLRHGPALANGMWEKWLCAHPKTRRTPLMVLLVPPVLLPPPWKECVKRQLLVHEEQRGGPTCTQGPSLIPPCLRGPAGKLDCYRKHPVVLLRYEGRWFHSIIIANTQQARLNFQLQAVRPQKSVLFPTVTASWKKPSLVTYERVIPYWKVTPHFSLDTEPFYM